MSYQEERRTTYRDEVPAERRVVEEQRVVRNDPAYDATMPLGRTEVREQVVEDRYAPPVYDAAVSDRIVEDESAGRLSTLDLVNRLIWFFTALLLADLTARFILKATGANTSSGFVSFVYNSTGAFVAPFRGIFGDATSGSAVLEPSTIVAIVVYAVLAFFVTWLLSILLGGPSRGVREYRRDVRSVR